MALEWCRANAPDLRLAHAEDASGARFTYGGQVHVLEAEGGDHRDAIVRRVYETIRALQGDPVRQTNTLAAARQVEQRIVAARWRGQHAEADALEQQLLELRAGVDRRRPAPRVRHEGVIPQQRAATRWQW